MFSVYFIICVHTQGCSTCPAPTNQAVGNGTKRSVAPTAD